MLKLGKTEADQYWEDQELPPYEGSVPFSHKEIVSYNINL